MRNHLRNYFNYSRLERNGILVLALLSLMVLLIPQFIPGKKMPASDFEKYETAINQFLNASSEQENIETPALAQNLFEFDPNTASEEILLQLGLSPKLTRTILNYRNKGGKFYKKEDLKKIYGMTSELYTSLENFILISKKEKQDEEIEPVSENVLDKTTLTELFDFDPNTVSAQDLSRLGFSRKAAANLMKYRSKGGMIRSKEELSKIYGLDEALFEKLYPHILINSISEDSQKKTKEVREVTSIDINAASTEEWKSLPGIGPYYSKNIKSFRDKLGGFYDINQVAETYRLPDTTFQKIKSFLKIDSEHQKINLNLATKEDLQKHPYISYKEAELIVNYRSQHGSFKTIDDLKKIKILDQNRINKVKPYLTLN